MPRRVIVFIAPAFLLLAACSSAPRHPAAAPPAASTIPVSSLPTSVPTASSPTPAGTSGAATPLPPTPTPRVASPAAAGVAQVTVFAGAGPGQATNRDGHGTDAVIFRPGRLAVDQNGTLYVAGAFLKTVAPDATVTTVHSTPGLAPPFGSVFVDPRGNLLITQSAQLVRRTPDGSVAVLAGGERAGYADGPATAVLFDLPGGIALDMQGNLYVADGYNQRVRKIAPDCTVSTLAGSGPAGEGKGGFADGPAASARFNQPSSVVADAQGVLFVGDLLNHRIRRVTPDGQVTTLAGSGRSESRDGRGTAAAFVGPYQIALDRTGTLYVADGMSLRRVSPDGTVTTLAANQFSRATGVAIGPDGALYVADFSANQLDKVTLDGAPAPVAVPVSAARYCAPAPSTARSATPTSIPAPRTTISETTTDNAFSAPVLTVPANQPVTLTVTNKGQAIHNLDVTDAKDTSGKDIKVPLLQPGESTKITFTIARPGTYHFQDDVHPVEQKGLLYVVASGSTPSP